MVGGRRVTDAATLEVMKMVVAGQVNVDLCAALRAAGVPAVGLHGVAAACVARASAPAARRHRAAAPSRSTSAWWATSTARPRAARALLAAAATCRCWPASARGADGDVFNINADTVANQLAAALGRRRRWFVTDVAGVLRDKDDPAIRIPRLTVAEARAAIADGVIQGGMIPKLEEAFAPLAAGIGAVHIVGPREIAASLARRAAWERCWWPEGGARPPPGGTSSAMVRFAHRCLTATASC